MIDVQPMFTAHWLYAAVNVARTVVGSGGWTAKQLQTSYWESSTGGVLNVADMERGQRLLEHLGLLVWREGRCWPVEGFSNLAGLPDDVAMRMLIHRGLLRERPIWLFQMLETADDTVADVLPDRVGEALRQLFPDPAALAAELHGLAVTVDAEFLREIGLAGEEHVVQECKEFFRAQGDLGLVHKVQRVSAFDDTLGYDVTATDRRAVRHKLEVKTTTAHPGARIKVYLSRNEARIGLANRDWSLVAVRDWVDNDGDRLLQTVGWLDAATFAQVLPQGELIHEGLRGRWQSIRLEIPVALFRPGLPLDQLTL